MAYVPLTDGLIEVLREICNVRVDFSKPRPARPYCSIDKTDGKIESDSSGDVGVENAIYQISVYADTIVQAEITAKDIKDALKDVSNEMWGSYLVEGTHKMQDRFASVQDLSSNGELGLPGVLLEFEITFHYVPE